MKNRDFTDNHYYHSYQYGSFQDDQGLFQKKEEGDVRSLLDFYVKLPFRITD